MKVFFDFDGTLMNRESDKLAHSMLTKQIEKRYGFSAKNLLKSYEKSIEKNKPGEKWVSSLDLLQDWFLDVVKNGPTNWFLEEYFRMHKKYARFNDAAVELLKFLKEKKIYVGLISDADMQYINFQIKPIESFFDSITTSEEAGYNKPSKIIFEKALEKSGPDNEIFYIGNSIERDITGAKSMGFKTILVFGNNDEADYCAKDLHECMEILKRAEEMGSHKQPL